MTIGSPHILVCASGSVNTPKLDIMIYLDDLDRAKEECSRIAAKLSEAGYSRFYLYDVTGQHVQVARFKVELQEPIVIIS